ncbi:hypothetical protein NDU88_011990 [Pleurodeles waltl]|uniref:Uncharacterized protein n=1 Tax=Pleurodeles waltl TaxID=8319 RepID=A0AAV7R2P1_PLEWA|nr:hypothetical protein NDU88_011990 [Pleurodeles waltl]
MKRSPNLMSRLREDRVLQKLTLINAKEGLRFLQSNKRIVLVKIASSVTATVSPFSKVERFCNTGEGALHPKRE